MAFPTWIYDFITSKYFSKKSRDTFVNKCPYHNGKKTQCQVNFCTNCGIGHLCEDEFHQNGKHEGHHRLRVRKATNRNTILKGDISQLMDVSGIQVYSFNTGECLNLLSKCEPDLTGHCSLPNANGRQPCHKCGCPNHTDKGEENALYCSIWCKLFAVCEDAVLVDAEGIRAALTLISFNDQYIQEQGVKILSQYQWDTKYYADRNGSHVGETSDSACKEVIIEPLRCQKSPVDNINCYVGETSEPFKEVIKEPFVHTNQCTPHRPKEQDNIDHSRQLTIKSSGEEETDPASTEIKDQHSKQNITINGGIEQHQQSPKRKSTFPSLNESQLEKMNDENLSRTLHHVLNEQVPKKQRTARVPKLSCNLSESAPEDDDIMDKS